jgi:hypothetical protein
MKRTLALFFLIFLVLQVFPQFPNIMIGNLYAPEETSIAINPKNPDQVVAAANIDSYYYSDDGGTTWQWGCITSGYGVWGDPCLITDTCGNFYFIHLSNTNPGGSFIDRIVCQKSVNGGVGWSDGTFLGLNGTKAQDKPWAINDPATNNIYVCWTQFDEYGSPSTSDSSVILFSRSTDAGATWCTPKRISRVAGDCLDSDNTVEGSVPAVGPAGEIYVAWAGPEGLVFNRSLDQGVTWMDTNVFISDIPGGWDFAVPGIYRGNGLPITCCDLSNGPYRGHVYVNWSDQRNGTDDTDVWFIKSTDGGMTWGERKRVNDDLPGKQQFFTWMTVDQVTGVIYFVFYDRRAYDNNLTDVYLAVSRDGGETFTNLKLSESPFLPYQSVFFGDYTGISAFNNRIRPVWTRLDGAQLSVWTTLSDSIFTGSYEKPGSMVSLTLEQNYPNPGKDFTYFSYKVHKPSTITMTICDLYGRELIRLQDRKPVSPGKYVEYFDISGSGLKPGVYFLMLLDDEQSSRVKIIIE